MGGVQWGSAADGGTSTSRCRTSAASAAEQHGHRRRSQARRRDVRAAARDGERVWYTPPAGCGERPRCSPAQSAAVSAIPGVGFSGSVDGHMRAYSTADGEVVWDFDTVRPYETVNGVPGRGGSFDGPGPAIAGGMLFINSGYARRRHAGQRAARAEVDGK